MYVLTSLHLYHALYFSPISFSFLSFFLSRSLPFRATVHVRVNDVNEFSPVFVERRYEASVPEGRLFDRIVRVEALDADCSPQYSQICFYDILTPNIPFVIDNDGENYSYHNTAGLYSSFPQINEDLASLYQSHFLYLIHIL